MKYLLDTHILLWSVEYPTKIPEQALDIIAEENNDICYSSISIWEATIKRLVHPDKIADITPQEFASFCTEAGFQELPLTAKHVYALPYLTRLEDSPPHKDPFDRILIAQAKSEGMTFLTHDALLPYYNEPCIVYV